MTAPSEPPSDQASEPLTTALEWTEDGARRSAHWHSENQSAAPTQVTVISDDITADAAYRLARSGAALLWRGDYHNGRQLLQAMDRRVKRHSARRGGEPANTVAAEAAVRGHSKRSVAPSPIVPVCSVR